MTHAECDLPRSGVLDLLDPMSIREWALHVNPVRSPSEASETAGQDQAER